MVLISVFGAGNEIRTRDKSLEGSHVTTTPYPLIFGTGGEIRTPDTRFWRPLLYQMSYTDAIGFPATLGASHLGRCFTLGQLLTERS